MMSQKTEDSGHSRKQSRHYRNKENRYIFELSYKYANEKEVFITFSDEELRDIESKRRFRRICGEDKKGESKQIFNPPGFLLLQLSEFFCSKQLHERVFQQCVSDMREEYFESISKGRELKAKWVLARGYLWLIWTVLLQLFLFAVSGPVKIIKNLWD